MKKITLILLLLTFLTGCGTIMSNTDERNDWPKANLEKGSINREVLFWDSTMLLAGVVPGVVALTIDYLTDDLYGSQMTVKYSEVSRYKNVGDMYAFLVKTKDLPVGKLLGVKVNSTIDGTRSDGTYWHMSAEPFVGYPKFTSVAAAQLVWNKVLENKTGQVCFKYESVDQVCVKVIEG